MKKIAIPVKGGFEYVRLIDLIKCETEENRKTRCVLIDGQHIISTTTIKELEILLNDFHFSRVHNSYIINLSYVKKINRGKNYFVELENGESIPVSFRRRKAFIEKIKGE